MPLQVNLRSSMKIMDIAELAKQSGMPASTLRYYEEKGLIESIGRRGLRRLFGPEVLERLSLIALGRAAGFSLDEIGGLFGQNWRAQFDRVQIGRAARREEGFQVVLVAVWSVYL